MAPTDLLYLRIITIVFPLAGAALVAIALKERAEERQLAVSGAFASTSPDLVSSARSTVPATGAETADSIFMASMGAKGHRPGADPVLVTPAMAGRRPAHRTTPRGPEPALR